MTQDEAVGLLHRFVDALNRKNRVLANATAFALIEGKPRLGNHWQAIAKVLQTNGELNAANMAMALFAAESAPNSHAHFLQAAMLAQTGQAERALAVMDNLPLTVPDVAGHHFICGTIAINLGRLDLAESNLLAALDADPRSGQAMLALASTRKRKQSDIIGNRIIVAGTAIAGASPLERAQFHFAAGRVHLDRDQPADAFQHFASGANIISGIRPYNAQADTQNARECIAGFDREMIAKINAQIGTSTSKPIFVTGLPRSGTTLIEQILVSHSTVAGGEELGRMSVVLRDLSSSSADGLNEYLRTGGKAQDLAALYIHLGQERFGKEGRFVDKALNTSRFIGMITAILPQASIIWLRRDPLDCAWSAYRTYFLQGLDWSWNLEDIASHFVLEDALFHHWSTMFPDRILPVDYQELVNDPESQIRRILKHCNLIEEPQVFRPHETKRIVSTASVMQVREPINTAAVGAANPYRSFLAPFTKRYAALSQTV